MLFRVHDTGEMRQELYGYWIGVVRPQLAWHTVCIGPAIGETEHAN